MGSRPRFWPLRLGLAAAAGGAGAGAAALRAAAAGRRARARARRGAAGALSWDEGVGGPLALHGEFRAARLQQERHSSFVDIEQLRHSNQRSRGCGMFCV